MTSRRLVASGLLGVAALAGLTGWRAHARGARALRDYPPEGQLLAVDGLTIHAVVRGEGPDLVLIHGASGSSRDFTFSLVDRLAADYRVIAFDRPGLGHSSPLPDNDASLAGQVAVLKAAAYLLGARNPLLVGQSYGGTIAMTWALTHPAAALVTLAAPALPWPGMLSPWYRATASGLGRALLVPLAAAWVPESYVEAQVAGVFAPDMPPPGYLAHLGADLTLRPAQLAANAAQINSLRPQIVELEPRWPGLTLPVEMVHGTADTVVPLDIHSRPLAPRLPQATLTVIEGAGHMPHHTHPETVLAAIRRAAARAGLR